MEDHRAVWIADLARALPEGDGVVRRFSRLSETSFDPHFSSVPRFSPHFGTSEREAIRHRHQHSHQYIGSDCLNSTKSCGVVWGRPVNKPRSPVPLARRLDAAIARTAPHTY